MRRWKSKNFNEDGNEWGENLIYIGKSRQNIAVKYYEAIFPPPPPPPSPNESYQDYNSRIKKEKDSLSQLKKPFFKNDEIPLLFSKNDNSVDSLSNKNLEIIVKENDTIPLYKQDYRTQILKKYYAFPIFIKNISTKILRIPSTSTSVSLYIFDDHFEKFYFARNSNYRICGIGTDFYSYFELNPNEILIYAYPHLTKGTKQKAKMKFYNASSKEFEISIDENITKKQYSKFYE